MNDSEYTSQTRGLQRFESQWFVYPDTSFRKLHRLCVVKYYVSNDTLYTSEKYHFVSLIYSNDSDNSMMYQHMIFFDKKQNTNVDGWYSVHLDKNSIPREPDTHLSGFVLNAYIGNKYPNAVSEHKPHANAYLFNATKEIEYENERDELSEELKKLIDIIK